MIQNMVVTPSDGHMGQKDTWANKIFATRSTGAPIGNAVCGAAAGSGANSEAPAAAAQRHALQELGLEALKQKGAEAGVLASDVSHTGRKTPWVEDAIMRKCLGYNNNDLKLPARLG